MLISSYFGCLVRISTAVAVATRLESRSASGSEDQIQAMYREINGLQRWHFSLASRSGMTCS